MQQDSAVATPSRDGTTAGQAPAPLAALKISGVVLSKREVLEALRNFLPAAQEFGALPDGQRFFLLVGDTPGPARS